LQQLGPIQQSQLINLTVPQLQARVEDWGLIAGTPQERLVRMAAGLEETKAILGLPISTLTPGMFNQTYTSAGLAAAELNVQAQAAPLNLAAQYTQGAIAQGVNLYTAQRYGRDLSTLPIATQQAALQNMNAVNQMAAAMNQNWLGTMWSTGATTPTAIADWQQGLFGNIFKYNTAQMGMISGAANRDVGQMAWLMAGQARGGYQEVPFRVDWRQVMTQEFGQWGPAAGLPTGKPLFSSTMQIGLPQYGMGLTGQQSAALVWGQNWAQGGPTGPAYPGGPETSFRGAAVFGITPRA